MAVIDFVSKKLGIYKRKKLREIRDLVADSITEVEIMATRAAPKFISIDKKISNGGYTGEVGVMGDNEMAAYIEFGTGLSAAQILAPYPQWIKDIAMQFYITGEGTLKGKPYLYNNFLVIEEKFKKELQRIIDEPFK